MHIRRTQQYQIARRLGAIAILTLGMCLALVPSAFGQFGDGVLDPRYYPGDWAALTSVRYVSSAVMTDDILYLGTRGGIARYDRFDNVWITPLTVSNGLPSNNILNLAYDRARDMLYARTDNGSASYQRVSREWEPVNTFPEDKIQPFESIDLTKYFLPFGYNLFDPRYINTPNSQSYEVVGAVEDDRGRTWIATWGLFVWVHEAGGFNIVPDRYGLYHDAVDAIFLDDEGMYFGGLSSIDGESGFTEHDLVDDTWGYYQSRYIRTFASDFIYDMTGKENGRMLYMATDHGVVQFDRVNKQFRSYGRHSGLTNEYVLSVCLDGDILWVGTDTGIDGVYLPTDSIFHATTSDLQGAHIYEIDAVNDVVWVGTDFGLYRLAKPTPVWRRYSPETGPLSGHVQAITHDGDWLYVGSDRGLAIIDIYGVKPAQVYENPSVLPYGEIHDIAVTDSIIWLGMTGGLLRFVPSTLERRLITISDGLLDNRIEDIVVDGDYLWLATNRGVNRFRWNNPLRVD